MAKPATGLNVVTTPNPLSLDGQRAFRSDIQDGDTLRTFLERSVEDFDAERWQITVDGYVIEESLWDDMSPVHGQLIEVTSLARNNNVLRLIAFAVLMYFTMGAGGIAGGSFMGMTGAAGYAAATAAFLAGSVLINKVLPPVMAETGGGREAKSVFNLGDQRNQMRRYDSMPILFGEVLIAPDIISNAYPNYSGEDQFLNMILTPGFNVAKVSDMRIGDNPIGNYDEITANYAGFPDMPEEQIKQYTNVDVTPGGTLEEEVILTRTTSDHTIAFQIDIEYILFAMSKKGKEQENAASIEMHYRKVGDPGWTPVRWDKTVGVIPWPGLPEAGVFDIPGATFRNRTQDTKRQSFMKDGLEAGQYEVRLKWRKQKDEGTRYTAKFSWSNLNSIQEDSGTYTGIPRIGFSARASGQFAGSIDQVMVRATARAMPYWNGSAWVTATNRDNGLSNPGAIMLLYAKGIYDNNGNKVGGMGLPDEMIDVEAMQEFMVHCANRGYKYDFWLTDKRNHDAALQSITLAGMGRYTWANGRLSVVWADADQGPKGAVNMANMRNMTFQVEYALVNAADGIEYTFFNREKWETETIRIPAPGVTTMLQPAQIASEGVTDFEHALTLARYHLAQSLYQTKDIQFGTDIEAMHWRQMNVVSLQHDLTQWGYGGRLVGFVDGQRPKLIFDSEVPATTTAGQAWVGLREPGTDNYHIMEVMPTVGDTNEVILKEAWPASLKKPNTGEGYEAMNYLWSWDIKETPGALVRITGISFNNDYQTADVTAVIENDEFWHFVETGEYIPPANISSLPRRPVTYALKAVEANVTTDNVVETYLDVSFEVTGFMTNAYVYVYPDVPGTARALAGITRERRMLVPLSGAGRYIVRVQPYGLDGILGVPAQITYDTSRLDAKPVNFDWFTIDDMASGVRRYSWGYNFDTVEPANLAGAEIRYAAGSVAQPIWDDMIPLGGDGFHTAAFEDVLPNGGMYTFGIRSRNTGAELSDTMLTVQKALSDNLNEKWVDVNQQLTDTELRLLEVIGDVDENSAAIVKQASAQYDIQGEQRVHRGYIARLDEVKVDEDGAKAIAQQIVSANVGDLRAAVEETSRAVVDMNGKLEASYQVKTQIALNGKYYMAGFSIGVYADGQTVQREMVVMADMFEIMADDGFGGIYKPFLVQNGTVYMNSAMIQNGSIDSAKIGSVIQSNNFVWNPQTGTYSGWQINKDGSAYFAGNVTIRGNVVADSITGQFQRTGTWEWAGVLFPISNGTTPSFVMDAPLRVGDFHTPVITLELTMDNEGGHSRDGVVYFERYNGSAWVVVRQKNFTLAASTNTANVMIIRDNPTNAPATYRVRVGVGGSSWGSWSFRGVYAILQGVR